MNKSLVGLVLMAGVLVGHGQAVAQEAASSVSIEALSLDRYTGIVKPQRSVLIAAANDGLLLALQVVEGTKVKSGQTLGRLDDRVQSAVVESASLRYADPSRMEQAAAQVSILEYELRMATDLHGKGVAHKREVDLAEVRLREGEAAMRGVMAEHQQLAADLRVEQERLESLRFVAPFSGVILERLSEPGTALRVGDGVYRVAALDPLRVELPLPVELYEVLKQGASYRLAAAGPINDELIATLTTIRPEIDSASATFVATFEIGNPELMLPAGFRVHLAAVQPIGPDELVLGVP